MNSRLNRPDYTTRDQSQFLDLQCDHCEAVIGVNQAVYANAGGDTHEFCCHGCAAAFEFINDNGLAGFYQRRNQFDKDVSSTSTAAKQRTTDWAFLDDPVEAQPYVSVANNGERQITVAVNGMYCPSCAWLIEKALCGAGQAKERIKASVDLTCDAVEIVIENESQKLSSLLHVIEQLGYQPTPLEAGRIDKQEHRLQNRSALKQIVVAGLGMMQVMTYAIAGYLGEFQGMNSEFQQFFALVSMLVATVVILYSGKSIFTNALVDLSHRRVGMDVPIALAILGAFVPSVYFTLIGHFESVYFDSAVMFVFFILVTRFAEARARAKLTPRISKSALSLPAKIRVKREGVWQFVAPYHVQVGDQAELLQHQSLAFDGTVVNDCITVDESVVTGEPIPRVKIAGDLIYAGSRLLSNHAMIIATESWDNSSLAKIDRLLSRAKMNSTSVQGSGDSATRHFVLATLILTAAVGATWWWIAPGQTLEIVLAMLVASCPCAFALAQPLATTAAVRRLRHSGVLVSNIDALIGLRRKVSWLFDKTGTLTVGCPKIVGSTLQRGVQSEHVHWLVASLQQKTHHPLSQAFTTSKKLADVGNQVVKVGAGVSGVVDGRTYYLGKPQWVKSKTKSWTAHFENYCQQSHHTLVALSSPDEVLAVFELADQVRAGAVSLITKLKKEGSEVSMLSGDNPKAVAHYATQLGIDCFFADLLPTDKHAHVDTQRGSGKTVVMVGDGTNDAPALHAADVGIALTSGSDIAQAQADVLLLNGRLDRLILLATITQRTQRVIAQNQNWALIYNAIALPLAAAGVLTPWLAVLGMTASSLLVVLNASRLAYAPAAD